MNEQCYYRISVKGIAVDEKGRFLLSKEENGMWELLGGGLEHNEDPVEGLKREIKEETGLEVTYISSSPIYFITSPRLGYDTYIANVIYEIKLKDLNFKASDECIELRYFTVEEAKKEKLFPNVLNFLKVYSAKNHLA